MDWIGRLTGFDGKILEKHFENRRLAYNYVTETLEQWDDIYQSGEVINAEENRVYTTFFDTEHMYGVRFFIDGEKTADLRYRTMPEAKLLIYEAVDPFTSTFTRVELMDYTQNRNGTVVGFLNKADILAGQTSQLKIRVA